MKLKKNNFMKNNNVLVFGGSGFLGSHVCNRLTNLGYNVTIFDKNESKFIEKKQKMIDENPELVQEVVTRLRAAFVKSLNDPKPTMDLILGKSKKVTPAVHMNAIRLMKEEFLPADYSKLGCMKSDRWAELAGQLKEVDVVPADFDSTSSFDLSFLGNCE